eukprot:968240-Prymnesium_polylepis.1
MRRRWGLSCLRPSSRPPLTVRLSRPHGQWPVQRQCGRRRGGCWCSGTPADRPRHQGQAQAV